MHHATLPGVSLLLLATLSAPLASQDKPTTFSADLGFVNAAGNTAVTSINVGEQVTHVSGAWKFQQGFSVLYGRTEGVKSAEQFRLGTRADYALSERLALYGVVAWDRNQFAGINRRFEEGVGLAYKAITGPSDALSLEAGVGLTQQLNTSDVSSSFMAGRAAALYKHTFAEKSYLQQAVEFIPNFETSEDYRIASETSLVAPLSDAVAFKATYVIRFDNLPEPTFKKTDRILTTGIQVNW